MNEHDSQAMWRWLTALVQHRITVIVTDDLFSYKVVAERLHLGHQVCQFHVRRWVGQILRELQDIIPKGWQWVLEEIQQHLETLSPEASKRLCALWKQLPGRRSKPQQKRTPLKQLRELLLRLSEHWPFYCTFQSEPHVP